MNRLIPEGEKCRPPTGPERAVCYDLQRLAQGFPESVWLYAAAGTLYVMQKNANGERAVLESEGMDPGYILAAIPGIECDGGDW